MHNRQLACSNSLITAAHLAHGCVGAGKSGKAERDMVSIAVAAGVPPSAAAMETAQRQLPETQGRRGSAAETVAAGRGALAAASAPPSHAQRTR